MAGRGSVNSTLMLASLVFACLAISEAQSGPSPALNDQVTFDESELTRILQHALAPLPPDSTNRYSDDPAAAHFGQYLFFEKRFSPGAISCAACHDPALDFTDGNQLAKGVGQMHRHTPSLWNVAHNRWFFWDGRADTLWAQALDPVEKEVEFGSSRSRVAHVIHDDANMRRAYEMIFGSMPKLNNDRRFPVDARPVPDNPTHPDAIAWATMSPDDQKAVNQIYVNFGKAIAAYERKIVTEPKSPFDVFVEGIKTSDPAKRDALSPSAKRGLKLFIGEGNCRLCHTGPNFTDGEFHNTGAPPLAGVPQDGGRFEGASKVAKNPFAATDVYSDDREGPSARKLKFMARTPETWGQFKTPSLRNVARTAPYMHQGQFATLREVIEFYSTRKGAVQIGHHQETILVPLNLTPQQIEDLEAFLESLSGPRIAPELSVPPSSPHPSDAADKTP